MSDTVIREVAKDIWTFSRPFGRFNIIPVGGRTTVIKLSNGDLWVLASTPLNHETKSKIDEVGGNVKYIIVEFRQVYPNAKLLGVPNHLSKSHLNALKFDGVYGKDPAGTKYGFEDEIKSCYFSGFQNQEIAFYHIASRTLIEADLLFNLPATEQYSKSKSSGRLPFIGDALTPYSLAHKIFVRSTSKDKEEMKQDARIVAGWDFNRIIPCHGDVIETGGKNAWLEAYKLYLL